MNFLKFLLFKTEQLSRRRVSYNDYGTPAKVSLLDTPQLHKFVAQLVWTDVGCAVNRVKFSKGAIRIENAAETGIKSMK